MSNDAKPWRRFDIDGGRTVKMPSGDYTDYAEAKATVDTLAARIAELEAQLEAARKDAKEDAERVKWMLPLLGGDDSPEADKRTLLLANELMRGKSGLEAIDAALEATTPES